MKYFAIVAVIVGLAFVSCDEDDGDGDTKGAKCCACLVDNDCWGYDLCPQSTDCYCIFDSSYSGDCPASPCLAWGSACGDTNCADECAGVTD